ncbi:zinc finger (C3HC4 RING finger) protein, putative, partial [Eimeria tenella]
ARMIGCLEGPTPDVEAAEELQEALKFVEALAARAAAARDCSSSSSSSGNSSSSSSNNLKRLKPLHERMQVFTRLLQMVHEQQLKTRAAKQQQQQQQQLEAGRHTGSSSSSSNSNSSSGFSFYQAADGQPIFLHPFCYQ